MRAGVARVAWIAVSFVSACSFEMRGPVAPHAGLQLGPGFYLGDEHQDGELSMTVGSSLGDKRADEPDEPMMMTTGIRYAHAVDPGGNIRLYGRGALGFEACPDDPKLVAIVGCDKDKLAVIGTDLEEVGAGVAFTFHNPGGDLENIASLAIGVVYREESSRERGRAEFTGLELTLLMGGDVMTWMSEVSKKHD